jgi:capsular polysaccharide biosynthesis protein
LNFKQGSGHMAETISLIDILHTLKKRWRIIVLTTLVSVLVGVTLTYFILTPIYQASTQILVNQKSSENTFDYSLMRNNVDLINTYSVIIRSPAILDKVINQLDLKQDVEELEKDITITSQDNSQVFSLVVKNPDASKAVSIANTISETFQNEIKGIMKVDNVSIIAKAELKKNPDPISPIPLLNIAIAVVIGLLFGVGISLLLEYMDTSLKNDVDVAALLGLPVLGTIQDMPNSQKGGRNSSKIKKRGSETIVSYAKE